MTSRDERRAAERALLGGLLQAPERLVEVRDIVGPADFVDPHLAAVFKLLLSRSDAGEPVDMVSLAAELAGQKVRRPGVLLAELAGAVATATHVRHHAKLVAQYGRLANLEKSLKAFERDASSATPDAVAELVERAGREFSALAATVPGVKGAGGSGRSLTCRPFAEIAPERLEWLWPDRIPMGTVTLLFGDPGLGKSMLTVDLAAAVSRGGRLPDGAQAPGGAVLFLSAEDDAGTTIRPRLDAAGADVERVHEIRVPGRWFSLADDLKGLEAEVERIGDVRLVVIDPVSAFLGSTDSHRNADVRQLLGPLVEMAGRSGVALILVTHLNKGTGTKALYRATGSLAFVAAARAAWAVVQDPEDSERRLFLPAKSNLGPKVAGLAYRIKGRDGDSPVLDWEPGPVDVDVDSVIGAQAGSGGGSTARDAAAKFLQELLDQGPCPAKEVRSEADRTGLSWVTVRRAAEHLRVVNTKRGFGAGGCWYWSLPTNREHDS